MNDIRDKGCNIPLTRKITFGKYKGKTWGDLIKDKEYYEWCEENNVINNKIAIFTGKGCYGCEDHNKNGYFYACDGIYLRCDCREEGVYSISE